ncbi:hypothetical protein EDEG_04234, partial [Edhazardia aedis USNM 41457]
LIKKNLELSQCSLNEISNVENGSNSEITFEKKTYHLKSSFVSNFNNLEDSDIDLKTKNSIDKNFSLEQQKKEIKFKSGNDISSLIKLSDKTNKFDLNDKNHFEVCQKEINKKKQIPPEIKDLSKKRHVFPSPKDSSNFENSYLNLVCETQENISSKTDLTTFKSDSLDSTNIETKTLYDTSNINKKQHKKSQEFIYTEINNKLSSNDIPRYTEDIFITKCEGKLHQSKKQLFNPMNIDFKTICFDTIFLDNT